MGDETTMGRWPGFLRPFAARPRLIAGLVVSILVYVLSSHWIVRDITRAIIAWDIGALTFIVLAVSSMADCNHEQMKQRALRHDEGKHFILLLTLFAAVASIAALGAELAAAKAAGARQEGLRVALSAGTIGLSWMFVQVVFTQHYAHHYYMEHEERAGQHREGLDFPGDEPPDYWDFLHFAVIIGATAQTADVTIVSKSLRRVATVHSMISFAFNTAILALMINLAAGLF